jgi:3',5'-cyclic-AMP phosphodiesterase
MSTGFFHRRLGRHTVAIAPAVCSAFALDLWEDVPVRLMMAPTRCAIIYTGPRDVLSVVQLNAADRPLRRRMTRRDKLQAWDG